MSPQVALENSAFRFYATLVLGVLGVAGVVIATLRWGLKKNVEPAWQSYRGWLIMVPLALGAIFLGREVAIVFFTTLAVFGCKEFARATGLYADWLATGTVYLGVIVVGITTLVRDPYLNVPGWYGLFMALPVYVIATILTIPVLRNRTKGQLQVVALAMVAFMYLGWMFGHLAFLTNAKHAYAYLMYLLVAVELNDVAAFTCGKLLGRHKLRSEVSPKKTWEGSVGALVVSMALPWLLGFTLPHFSSFDKLLVGLVVGVGGQLGDLAISVIKRDVGVKDMGAAIPGHGGILDRVDSLIYVAPLFFHVVRFRHDIY
ncbi:MAG: phosphatidate cytidylyltransferase [Gemmataceae bacterium]